MYSLAHNYTYIIFITLSCFVHSRQASQCFHCSVLDTTSSNLVIGMMTFTGASLLILSLIAVFAVRHVVLTHKNGRTTHVHVHPARQEIPLANAHYCAIAKWRRATDDVLCHSALHHTTPATYPAGPSGAPATNPSQQAPEYVAPALENVAGLPRADPWQAAGSAQGPTAVDGFDPSAPPKDMNQEV